jgi:hypothetical protein
MILIMSCGCRMRAMLPLAPCQGPCALVTGQVPLPNTPLAVNDEFKLAFAGKLSMCWRVGQIPVGS